MSWPDDPVAAVTHPDPYPYYASLAGAPLRRHEHLGLLVAARTADVAAVLSSDLLRVRPPAEPVPRAIAGGAAGEVFGRLVRMTDGAAQTAGTRAVREALASVDPRAAGQVAHGRAARLAAALDLARRPERAMEVAWHVPVRTMADLVGLAPDDSDAASERTRVLVGGFAAGATAEDAAASASAATFLGGALTGGGLHGALARAAAAGGLDAAFVAANAVGLLSQTLEATAGLVGNALVALARTPGLGRAVRSGGGDALVREVMRHDPPVQNTRRFAAAAGPVADVSVAEGDAILVVLAAPGRDPARYDDPDAFRLDRPPRRAPAFGDGRHGCPGDALAQALAAGCLEALLDAGLATEALVLARYRPSPNVRIPVFADGGRR
jgi:cytochrome P450